MRWRRFRGFQRHNSIVANPAAKMAGAATAAASIASTRDGTSGLMGEQRPGEGAAQHAPGRSAENELTQLGMGIAAHHQQVDVALGNMRLENIADRPALGRNLVECHLDAMPGQVLAQLYAGTGLVQTLLVDDGDDMDMLGRLQYGERVGDGSGRGP